MGRQVKRVALNFQWPLNQIWKGYVTPYRPVECNACSGTGYSAEYRHMQDRWYGNHQPPHWIPLGQGKRYNANAWSHNLTQDDVAVLLDHNRLWDFTRIPRTEQQREDVRRKIASGENSWLPYDNGYHPTAEEVNLWSLQGFGHDSLNASYCIEARLKREGLSVECDWCEGRGHFWQSPEIEQAADAWQPIEPPTGEGWQLWENTTEGSPVSPVFETLEALCLWCADNATTFGDSTATAEEWKRMLTNGFVYHAENNIIMM